MHLTRKSFSLRRTHAQLMQSVDYASWLKSVLLLAALVVLPLGVGCLSVAPPSASLSGFKEKDYKNFQLNENYTSNVGEAIVTRQKYRYKESSSFSRATASVNFEIRFGMLVGSEHTYKGRRDEQFTVAGRTKHKGKDCMIVVIPYPTMQAHLPSGILVNGDDGHNYGASVTKDLWGNWLARGSILVEPSDVRFPLVLNVEIDRASQYENYEIIYTGKNGDNINLVYREFTHTDLARPSFNQNLTYNMAESKTIRFRKLQMEIKEASNQLITLKVVSDN